MPKCGRETEVFSRVVGYHRPVKLWNKGKQAEFRDRKLYSPTVIAQRLAERAKTPAGH